ncbi:MAG: hypothetical protein K8R02_05135 [Anaerohalosphaeraceae bacterium]|nr:hypothetical protein [Anaerohalosphaeraceae bacterium]
MHIAGLAYIMFPAKCLYRFHDNRGCCDGFLGPNEGLFACFFVAEDARIAEQKKLKFFSTGEKFG